MKKSIARRRKSRKRSVKRKKSQPKIILQKSRSPNKKFMVTVDSTNVNFGAKGYSDYTKHKNKSRMRRYEKRHKSRENWKKSGMRSAGFWSKWILWNKPGFLESIKDTQKRFGVKIVYKKKSNRRKDGMDDDNTDMDIDEISELLSSTKIGGKRAETHHLKSNNRYQLCV